MARPASPASRHLDLHEDAMNDSFRPDSPGPRSAPLNNASLAEKVSWAPLCPGGANFKTRNVTLRRGVVKVTVAAGMVAFTGIFIGMGLLFVGIGGAIFLSNEDAFAGIAFAAGGQLFACIGGWLLWRASKPFTLDRSAGTYYLGARAVAGRPRTEQGSLADIRAIQLLSERISGDTSYTSYEINLVCRDGVRINVLDHGDHEAAQRAATLIGDYLKVPVWRR